MVSKKIRNEGDTALPVDPFYLDRLRNFLESLPPDRLVDAMGVIDGYLHLAGVSLSVDRFIDAYCILNDKETFFQCLAEPDPAPLLDEEYSRQFYTEQFDLPIPLGSCRDFRRFYPKGREFRFHFIESAPEVFEWEAQGESCFSAFALGPGNESTGPAKLLVFSHPKPKAAPRPKHPYLSLAQRVAAAGLLLGLSFLPKPLGSSSFDTGLQGTPKPPVYNKHVTEPQARLQEFIRSMEHIGREDQLGLIRAGDLRTLCLKDEWLDLGAIDDITAYNAFVLHPGTHPLPFLPDFGVNPESDDFVQWATDAERVYGSPRLVTLSVISNEIGMGRDKMGLPRLIHYDQTGSSRVSSTGAIGVPQAFPRWWPELDYWRLKRDTRYGTFMCAQILSTLYRDYRSWDRARFAYHSPDPKYKHVSLKYLRRAKMHERIWHDHLREEIPESW